MSGSCLESVLKASGGVWKASGRHQVGTGLVGAGQVRTGQVVTGQVVTGQVEKLLCR